MKPLTIGKLLVATDELKALTRGVRRLGALQAAYVRSAPAALGAASRVKNYRSGTLFVTADNAAVASKLKQMTPRLLATIRASEPEISAIRIDVHVSDRSAADGSKSSKAELTPEAIASIDALAQRVTNEGLKSALAKMARRQGKSKRPP